VESWFPVLSTPKARPVGRPLLALSDIHGDLDALESVLSAVKRVPLSAVVATGDHCFGGPEPFRVWQRLQELSATLARGETDLALASLDATGVNPDTKDDEARLRAFVETRVALGDIVCRRLGELPVTAVVSLDDRAGVMVMHGSPRDPGRALLDSQTDVELEHETGCAAEDVLVLGKSHHPFARRIGALLLVNAGSVGQSELVTPAGQRTAHAALVQEFSDGVVRTISQDVVVKARATRREGRRRSAG
jgi:predicted phosphodiesterase